MAVWRAVGLSEVEKMKGAEDGISMGPSSGVVAVVVVIGSSGTWASHGWVVVRWLWAETEWKMVVVVVVGGLQRKLREEGEMGSGENERKGEGKKKCG